MIDQTLKTEKSWQKKFYEAAARRSPQVIRYFKFVYVLIFFVWLWGAYVNFSDPESLPTYISGLAFGRGALILLGIVVLPGILGRFGIEIPITRIITTFRRQLGITVFLLAFTHYSFLRLFPLLVKTYTLQIPPPYFEIAGMCALTFLFLMFLTSNNYSQKKLGRGWKRLHRIVYVVIWLLVLHTALQRVSIFSLFIFAFAIIETASLIYNFFRQKSAKSI